MPCGSRTGGEAASGDLRVGRGSGGMPRRSSADDEMGEDRAGEEMTVSSKSDPEIRPASKDAAKLLENSGSDMTAYDDCVDTVEAVEVVRSRAERREGRGSSCHTEAVGSTLPYSCPYSAGESMVLNAPIFLGLALTTGGWPRTPATR